MYFYIKKDSLLSGRNITVIFQTETAIPNYKQITNFGELVEYKGDNIPNDWEYSEKEDTLYSAKDKPSPYHVLKNKQWVVEDKDGFKDYCFKNIDKIKKEILEYGFDYEIDGITHRQRCRDKDISLMGTTMTFMLAKKLIFNKDDTTSWFFEDNVKKQMNLNEILNFATFGKSFMEAIYLAENYFKTLDEPRLITKDEYLEKIKEFQRK